MGVKHEVLKWIRFVEFVTRGSENLYIARLKGMNSIFWPRYINEVQALGWDEVQGCR